MRGVTQLFPSNLNLMDLAKPTQTPKKIPAESSKSSGLSSGSIAVSVATVAIGAWLLYSSTQQVRAH